MLLSKQPLIKTQLVWHANKLKKQSLFMFFHKRKLYMCQNEIWDVSN